MKKTLILVAIFLTLPFATFAHGVIDDGDNTPSTQEETMNENMAGGMMGTSAGDHGGGDMAGGMMGGNIMWMGFLHALVGITSIVWLIAGILFLYKNVSKKKKEGIQQ